MAFKRRKEMKKIIKVYATIVCSLPSLIDYKLHSMLFKTEDKEILYSFTRRIIGTDDKRKINYIINDYNGLYVHCGIMEDNTIMYTLFRLYHNGGRIEILDIRQEDLNESSLDEIKFSEFNYSYEYPFLYPYPDKMQPYINKYLNEGRKKQQQDSLADQMIEIFAKAGLTSFIFSKICKIPAHTLENWVHCTFREIIDKVNKYSI